MKQHQRIILLLLILTCGKTLSQTESADKNVKIKVPKEWIDKLRKYDYKEKNNVLLLNQFERFIKPDSLVGLKEYPHENGGILNPIFVNLDNDPNEELIGLFGWSENYPTLAVFKFIDNSWYLLYLEPFYMFYNEPELQVVNNFSANKTFYIGWLYDRGSGIYRDAYHFYKLIDNKVYPCLDLINSAHIFGWGLYLNQTIKMNFKFNCATIDELWVSYDYNFFPGAVEENDVPWDGHEDLSFVKGSKGISYQWNDTTHTYQPQFYNNNDDELNKEKISCFGAFDNDTLFVSAFDYEIKQTLEKGTTEQKKLLEKYLKIVKTERKTVAPTGELEEKGQAGRLKFYGIKKKE